MIAIIAILASLLLPALQGAREHARTTLCASNMRQIGLGAIYYADDFQGNWATGRALRHGAPTSSQDHSYAFFTSLIYPDFVNNVDVFLCPSVNENHRRTFYADMVPYRGLRSWGVMARQCYVPNGAAANGVFNYNTWFNASTGLAANNGFALERYVNVHTPYEAYLVEKSVPVENYGGHTFYGNAFGSAVGTTDPPELPWHHRNALNFLFADGRVEKWSYNTARATWHQSNARNRAAPWRRPTGYSNHKPDM